MLTNIAIAALTGPKPYKRTDRDGLFLFVTPAGPRNQQGSRLWRMKYQFAGKAQLLSFGGWPEISLAEAREKCRTAREQLRAGINPAAAKRAPAVDAPTPGAPTFEPVAREWHARQAPGWDGRHAWDVLNSLERDVFPAFGSMPLSAITPPLVLTALRAIEGRGAIETAHRIRQRISAVFVYAIACGLAETDPAAIVKGALSTIVHGRQPAITDPIELRQMLAKAEAEHCHPTTKLGLRLLALTVVRPGELRGAQWSEFELANGSPVWRLPPDRMKAGVAHVVPLVPAAVDVLRAAQIFNPRGAFVFPNARFAHKPMSENALGFLLNRCGYHARHVPHGFRASFSTIMNEMFPGDADVIEACLAHGVPGVRGRYLRSSFNGRRRELLEEWAQIVSNHLPPAAQLLDGPRR
jgi:integrase